MFNYLLPKRIEKFDKIRFVIYKIGIDEKLKEKFKKEEEEYYEQNPQYQYEDKYYSVYYDRCFDYWRKEFAKTNKEFQEYLEGEFKCKTHTEKNYILSNEKIVENSGNEYLISYNYSIIEYEYMSIEFNLCRINKKFDYNQYDEFLEYLKEKVKDFWIKGTRDKNDKNENCYWMQDEQSERLSFKAYKFINNLENKFRFFINKVMIYNYGLMWNEIFDKESVIIKKYMQRKSSYKKDVNIFRNINNFLLSIDADDLVKIMQYKRVILDEKVIDEIISEVKTLTYLKKDIVEQKLSELSNKAYKAKKEIDVWNKCFYQLFNYEYKDKYQYNDEENEIVLIKNNIIEDWEAFCKFRNHIAHNKFINYELFTRIKNLASKIDIKLDEAEKQFNIQINDEEKDMEVNDYINGPYATKILQYNNMADREMVIFEEIIVFIKDIIKTVNAKSNIDLVFDESVRFIEKYIEVESYDYIDDYLKDKINGFKCFLESIIKNLYIDIININNKINGIAINVRIKKISGNNAVNYLVSIEGNGLEEKQIIIGHTGHEFIADGVPEDNEFLGGEWYNFIKDSCRYILEFIKNNN